MDTMAGCADVIEESFIEEVAGKQLAEFWKAVDDNSNFSREEVANDSMCDDLERYGVNSDILSKYRKLQKAFKKATKLSLQLNFHNADESGSRYDDVNGVFWSVDGMYALTPAGKKYQKKVNRAFFTTFG